MTVMEEIETDSREKLRGRRAVLDWLARVRVAGVEPMAAGLGVVERRVYAQAKNLEAEGLLLRPPVRDGGGGVLVITPRGVREAGYAVHSRTPTSSLAGLQHGRGISWIAAHCDRGGRPWFGPTEMREEGWPMKLPPKVGPGALTHMPDLAFVLNGKERWAGEFERVSKGPTRLRRILEGYRNAQLAGELAGVVYICANEMIARLVESTAAEVGLKRVVRTLDWLLAEVRGPGPARG